jgi:hypothetical protein
MGAFEFAGSFEGRTSEPFFDVGSVFRTSPGRRDPSCFTYLSTLRPVSGSMVEEKSRAGGIVAEDVSAVVEAAAFRLSSRRPSTPANASSEAHDAEVKERNRRRVVRDADGPRAGLVRTMTTRDGGCGCSD